MLTMNGQWMQLTVLASVGPTYGGDGRASSHYQLIKVTLVVCRLGLLEDKVVQVQPRQGSRVGVSVE